MTETKTNPKSILGSQSALYLIKSSKGSGILDIPDEDRLELYPAGYTHHSDINGANLQHVYAQIYAKAVEKNLERRFYPFDKASHYIELRPDPNNPHDNQAIHLILHANPETLLGDLDGKDLGYVPRRINKQINKNIDMFKAGYILKVRNGVHGQYCIAKIVLFYGDNYPKNNCRSAILDRFSMILEEQ